MKKLLLAALCTVVSTVFVSAQDGGDARGNHDRDRKPASVNTGNDSGAGKEKNAWDKYCEHENRNREASRILTTYLGYDPNKTDRPKSHEFVGGFCPKPAPTPTQSEQPSVRGGGDNRH